MSDDGYYCSICDEGPMSHHGVLIHQSRKHDTFDTDVYKKYELEDIDAPEVSDETIKRFIRASEKVSGERQQLIARAIIDFFDEKDGEIFYYRAKEISDDIEGILTPKEIGKGLQWLEEHSTGKLITVERWSNNTPSKWRIDI